MSMDPLEQSHPINVFHDAIDNALKTMTNVDSSLDIPEVVKEENDSKKKKKKKKVEIIKHDDDFDTDVSDSQDSKVVEKKLKKKKKKKKIEDEIVPEHIDYMENVKKKSGSLNASSRKHKKYKANKTKSVDDLTGEFLEVESNRRDPRDTVYQPAMSEASFPSTQCYTNAPPLNPYAPAQNPYALNQSPYAHYMTPPMPPYAPMPAINPYYNIPLQASTYMNTPMYVPGSVYPNLSSIADPTQTEDEKKAIKKRKAYAVLLKGFILFVNLNLLVMLIVNAQLYKSNWRELIISIKDYKFLTILNMQWLLILSGLIGVATAILGFVVMLNDINARLVINYLGLFLLSIIIIPIILSYGVEVGINPNFSEEIIKKINECWTNKQGQKKRY